MTDSEYEGSSGFQRLGYLLRDMLAIAIYD
jgi:hypothetical protein